MPRFSVCTVCKIMFRRVSSEHSYQDIAKQDQTTDTATRRRSSILKANIIIVWTWLKSRYRAFNVTGKATPEISQSLLNAEEERSHYDRKWNWSARTDSWLWESVCGLISITCLFAIIVILCIYERHPVPKMTLSITVRASDQSTLQSWLRSSMQSYPFLLRRQRLPYSLRCRQP